MGDIYLSQPPTRTNASNYIVARFARIVPLYFLVVILSFSIFRFLDPGFAYQITSTQLLRLLTFNGSVSVFWSVGPEVQFYAVFVLLWLVFARIGLFCLYSFSFGLLHRHDQDVVRRFYTFEVSYLRLWRHGRFHKTQRSAFQSVSTGSPYY
jgi:peptidoglycan/LPS O-acetylase OafA/YrhL